VPYGIIFMTVSLGLYNFPSVLTSSLLVIYNLCWKRVHNTAFDSYSEVLSSHLS
jgi:hypothetical protein